MFSCVVFFSLSLFYFLLFIVNVLLGPQLVIVSNTMWTGWQPTVPMPVTNVPVPTNTGYCLALS